MSFLDGYTPPTPAELDAAIWATLRDRGAAYKYDPRDNYEPTPDELSPHESDQAADRAEAKDTQQRERRTQ